MSYPITNETLRRLKKWSEGDRAGPTNLEIFFTKRCNLKCKMCEATYRDNSSDFKEEMSWDTIDRIIDEASELGVDTFFITGGEPTCRDKELVKAIEKIKRKGMMGHLVTNGTLIDDFQIKRIVESGWEHVMISLDSPVKEIHDYLRGKEGTFQRVLKTLKSFRKWKEKLDKDFPAIIVTCVITSVNFESFPKFIPLLRGLNIDELRFQPVIVYLDAIKKFEVPEDNYDDLKKILTDTKKLISGSEFTTNIGEFIDSELIENSSEVNKVIERDNERDINKTEIQCFQPWYGIKITPEGNIGPCESDFTWKSPINIKNRSLEEVWYGDYFNKIRKEIKNGLPEECAKCCVGKVFEQREIRSKLNNF